MLLKLLPTTDLHPRQRLVVSCVHMAYTDDSAQRPTMPSDSCTTAKHQFTDVHGDHVASGDSVNITWPMEGATYNATVQTIDHDRDHYTVTYDDPLDDTQYTHLLSEIEPMNVTKHVSAIARAALQVHHTVSEYVSPDFQVQESLILGHTVMPPIIFPEFHRDSIPTPAPAREALSSAHAIYWLSAMVHEIRNHLQPQMRQPTFQFTSGKPHGRKLNFKWVYTTKWNGDIFLKFKARLCLAGWGLTQGVHYTESYTGTAPIGDLYLLESLRNIYDLDCYEIDAVQAYCNERMPLQPNGQPVIAGPIPCMPVFGNGTHALNTEMLQALYGHPVSGYALARGTHDRLLNRHADSHARPCPIPLLQCPSQPVIFRADFPDDSPFAGHCFLLWINNDNIRVYVSKAISTDAFQLFRTWISSCVEITGGGSPLNTSPPETCLGVQIDYKGDGRGVVISMEPYIQQALITAGMHECNPSSTPATIILDKTMCPTTRDEQNESISSANKLFGRAIMQQYGGPFSNYDQVIKFYAQHVSTLGWIAKQVGPSISFAHSNLGRVMHAPCTQAFHALKRVYRYLKGHTDMSITQHAHKQCVWGKTFPHFYMQSDASFADDISDRKSQGGYVGGLERMPTYWASRKSQRVCTSTTHAETYHSCQAARHAVYVKNLLQFLQADDGQPITLELDSLSTVFTSGAPIRKFNQRQKHFHLDDFYTAQCVDDGTIALKHVPGAPTKDSPGFSADALTKPLQANALRDYYGILHGAHQVPPAGGEAAASSVVYTHG